MEFEAVSSSRNRHLNKINSFVNQKVPQGSYSGQRSLRLGLEVESYDRPET